MRAGPYMFLRHAFVGTDRFHHGTAMADGGSRDTGDGAHFAKHTVRLPPKYLSTDPALPSILSRSCDWSLIFRLVFRCVWPSNGSSDGFHLGM